MNVAALRQQHQKNSKSTQTVKLPVNVVRFSAFGHFRFEYGRIFAFRPGLRRIFKQGKYKFLQFSCFFYCTNRKNSVKISSKVMFVFVYNFFVDFDF